MPDHKERFNLRRIKTLIGVSAGSPGPQWKTKKRNEWTGIGAQDRGQLISQAQQKLLKFQINLGKTSCKSVDDIIPRLQSRAIRHENRNGSFEFCLFLCWKDKKNTYTTTTIFTVLLANRLWISREQTRTDLAWLALLCFALVLEYLYMVGEKDCTFSMVFMWRLICPVCRQRDMDGMGSTGVLLF